MFDTIAPPRVVLVWSFAECDLDQLTTAPNEEGPGSPERRQCRLVHHAAVSREAEGATEEKAP